MKLLLTVCLLAIAYRPRAAAMKDRTWTPAMVESSSRQRYDDGGTAIRTVLESVYVDAGEWLYHGTQIVAIGAALNVPDGGRVEVAEEGKKLIVRVRGKEYKLKIEQKSHGRKPGEK